MCSFDCDTWDLNGTGGAGFVSRGMRYGSGAAFWSGAVVSCTVGMVVGRGQNNNLHVSTLGTVASR